MIRKAVATDAGRIAEIHIFGWRAAYQGIVDDNYLFSKLSVEKRIKDFVSKNEHDIDEMYVSEENGIVEGFMKIGKCRNEDKLKAFELWGIYIEPLMKNKGIGSKLLLHCEAIARDRGYLENVLWVFENNTLSRRFYEKHGYIVDGKKELMERFNAFEIRYSKNL